jgi:hypothetical protein
MSDRTRLALFITATLLLFATVSLVIRTATEFDETRDHASTRTNPWGTKAWRELLEASDVRTVTWAQPLTELSDDVSCLVVLDPVEEIGSRELDVLMAWVQRGGRLILAPFAYRASSTFGGSGAHASLSRLLNRFFLAHTTGGDAGAAARPVTDGPLTADVSEVVVPTDGRLLITERVDGPTGDRPTTLLADEDGRPVAVAASYGEGRAIVLAEAEMLANATLPEADNVVFAANIVFADGAPEAVHFDEYHHGMVEVGGVFGGPEVDVTAFRNTALALLGVLVVYAIGRGRRFGAPITRAGLARRPAADFVRALARAHSRAGTASAAASMLADRLRRRSASAAAVPASADRESIEGALNARGLPGDEIADLLRRLEEADEDTTDAQLLALAQRTAHYERML